MKQVLRYAFLQTLPVLFGYLFLGVAFGILLQQAGFHFIWAFFISVFVYAGSMQFVLISFMAGSASLLSVAIMTLSVNSRHIFYGLSFIEQFKAMGRRYPYMIFSLTDETYSLLCGVKTPEGMDRDQLSFHMAWMDQCYWIAGSVLGALAGELLAFDTTGIDFAMTALFVVIFVEQWLGAKTHLPVFIGMACGVGSLLVFGPDRFILPSLIATVALLMLTRRHVESILHDEEGGETA